MTRATVGSAKLRNARKYSPKYAHYICTHPTHSVRHALIPLPRCDRFRPLLGEEICRIISPGLSYSMTAAECADGFFQLGNLVVYRPQVSLITTEKTARDISRRFAFARNAELALRGVRIVSYKTLSKQIGHKNRVWQYSRNIGDTPPGMVALYCKSACTVHADIGDTTLDPTCVLIRQQTPAAMTPSAVHKPADQLAIPRPLLFSPLAGHRTPAVTSSQSRASLDGQLQRSSKSSIRGIGVAG